MVSLIAASDDGNSSQSSKEEIMSASRSVERRFIRQLLNRRSQPRTRVSAQSLITSLSMVACLGLFAVFVPGLLWVLLLGAVVLALGS